MKINFVRQLKMPRRSAAQVRAQTRAAKVMRRAAKYHNSHPRTTMAQCVKLEWKKEKTGRK